MSDEVTIGAGVSLIPFVVLENQVFYPTPKVGIKSSENLSFARGALVVKLPDSDGQPTVGAAYGARRRGPGTADSPPAWAMVSLTATSPRNPWSCSAGSFARPGASFVTENYIFPGLDAPSYAEYVSPVRS